MLDLAAAKDAAKGAAKVHRIRINEPGIHQGVWTSIELFIAIVLTALSVYVFRRPSS